jgi:hypothetical protein
LNVIHLYRPVGLKEFDLIKQSDCKEFPKRLPDQPIFYPVLTYEYAELIISNWNINEKFAGYAGVITKFDVDLEFIKKYKVEIAGGPTLQELWIPSEELRELNNNIVPPIKIVGAFYGSKFKGKKIDFDSNIEKLPSQLYIDPSRFVKSEDEYQEWLKNNQN